jgi:hypothetical protein
MQKSYRVLLLCVFTVITMTDRLLACTNDQASCQFGPSLPGEQLLYDDQFGENCPLWVKFGNAVWTNVSGDAVVQIVHAGSVYQQFTPRQDIRSMDMTTTVKAVTNEPGTERMLIEIVRAADNTLLETVAIIMPGSGGISDYFDLNNYAGQPIKLRYRVLPGRYPGDTVFQVTSALVWGWGY